MVMRRRRFTRARRPLGRRFMMRTVSLNSGTTVPGFGTVGHVVPINLTSQWEIIQSNAITGCRISRITGKVYARPQVVPVVAGQDYVLMMAARWDDRATLALGPSLALDGLREFGVSTNTTIYGPWKGQRSWRSTYSAGASSPIEELQQKVTTNTINIALPGVCNNEQRIPVLYFTNLSTGAVPGIQVYYDLTVWGTLP